MAWIRKRRLRTCALMVALALSAGACAEPTLPQITAPATVTPTPAPTPTAAPTVANQPTPTPPPFSGEPGVTADTIRIGVIYDVGVDPVTDQMARSSLEAVQAWAASINAGPGLANRTVVVEPIETRPLLADHAEAIDRACNSDLFALVGSSALFDGLGVEQLESSDCHLPDFPATATSAARLASPVTTVSNAIQGNTWQAGWARYYADDLPDVAAAAATLVLDFDVAIIESERMIEAADAQGIEFVAQPKFAFDTDFTNEVDELAAAEPTLVIWRGDGGRLIRLLEAYDAADGPRPVIDCGQACYSQTWLDSAGPLAEGVSVWLPHRPLQEAVDTFELSRYQFWLGSTFGAGTEQTSNGIMAWSAALLFEEAVNRATRADTAEYDANNITRVGVIAAAHTVTEWDAKGLHGPSNPAAGVPSSCYVLLTYRSGAWQRTHPVRAGELDCRPKNLVMLTNTAVLGITPTPTPVPPGEATPPADGGPDEEGTDPVVGTPDPDNSGS